MSDAPGAAAGHMTVDFYGQDGEYAIADGHVDHAVFLTAVSRQASIPLDELDPEEIEHRYWRPATPDDGLEPFEDGWMFWGDVSASEGTPVTVLNLDQL